MSKPERFKEEIGWLKALCGVLIVGTTSLLVWLVQNYDTSARGEFSLALFGLFSLVTCIVVIVFRLYRCFKILEAQ